MSRGKRFESAPRLSLFGVDKLIRRRERSTRCRRRVARRITDSHSGVDPGTNDRGVAVGKCRRKKLIAEQLLCYPAKRSSPCLRPPDFFKQRRRTAGRRACGRVLCIALGAREYLTPRCYPPPRPR